MVRRVAGVSPGISTRGGTLLSRCRAHTQTHIRTDAVPAGRRLPDSSARFGGAGESSPPPTLIGSPESRSVPESPESVALSTIGLFRLKKLPLTVH